MKVKFATDVIYIILMHKSEGSLAWSAEVFHRITNYFLIGDQRRCGRDFSQPLCDPPRLVHIGRWGLFPGGNGAGVMR